MNIEQLLEQLFQATENNKLDWDKNEISNQYFLINKDKSTLFIKKMLNMNTLDWNFIISIYDADAKLKDEFVVQDAPNRFSPVNETFKISSKLFDLIGNYTNQKDSKFVDDFIKSLPI